MRVVYSDDIISWLISIIPTGHKPHGLACCYLAVAGALFAPSRPAALLADWHEEY